jgi:hypothetical protein
MKLCFMDVAAWSPQFYQRLIQDKVYMCRSRGMFRGNNFGHDTMDEVKQRALILFSLVVFFQGTFTISRRNAKAKDK